MRKSMGLHHMVQQHQQPLLDAIQKPDRQQSVRSQLSETNELVLEHFQGVRQAAAQRPLPRVTGNPFADPEDCDPDGNSHLSAPVAAQHEPEDTMLCSQLLTSHPCYRHEASVEPQPFAYTDVGTESAWDAVSASANTNESSQVRRLCSKQFCLSHLISSMSMMQNTCCAELMQLCFWRQCACWSNKALYREE